MRRGRASEDVAAAILEEMGYRIIGKRQPVVVEGEQVSDIDLVVEKNGVKYAVEVKAGYADVGGVRQAYVNALLTGMRPLIVARGFSGRDAEVLAEKLGVEVVLLSDIFVTDAAELAAVVEAAVAEALTRALSSILSGKEPSPKDIRYLEAIANSDSIASAAEALGVGIEDVGKAIARLKRSGVLSPLGRGYEGIRNGALAALIRLKLAGKST